jgi:hypothetical protein
VITLGALDTLGVSLAILAWFDGRAAAKTSRDLYIIDLFYIKV